MKINDIAKDQRNPCQLSQKLLAWSINTGFALGSISLLLGFTAHKTLAQVESGNDDLLEQIERYAYPEQDDALGQVTNINQLRDVSPTDWSYEARRSLVDRYGCISGFPNQTFRGNQSLSRYEFAAGLNSCLNQIERLIASNGSLSSDELVIIRRLSEEFSAEISALGERIGNIEERIAVNEDQQFSSTTKIIWGSSI